MTEVPESAIGGHCQQLNSSAQGIRKTLTPLPTHMNRAKADFLSIIASSRASIRIGPQRGRAATAHPAGAQYEQQNQQRNCRQSPDEKPPLEILDIANTSIDGTEDYGTRRYSYDAAPPDILCAPNGSLRQAAQSPRAAKDAQSGCELDHGGRHQIPHRRQASLCPSRVQQSPWSTAKFVPLN